ncbi:MAG: chemotaxis protein CheA [Rhodobacteraceae bacterium]|nr:MAG: chemotaxis protein CheA [Paracoccaceae bacterium]
MGALDELRQTFFEECEEQLAELEAGLLRMQEGEDDKELVNAVFRAVHSVKGGAGAFELTALVSFAHVFETALDEVRSDKLTPGPDLLKTMLRAADVLNDLVAAARDGDDLDEGVWRALADEIAAFCGGGKPAAPAAPAEPAATPPAAFTPEPIGGLAPSPTFTPAPLADFKPEPLAIFTPERLDIAPAPAPAGRRFVVMLRPHVALYEKANDAATLLRELDALGKARVECDLSELPTLDALDPLGAYLSWTVTLDTDETGDRVREVFEFCEDDCYLVIREEKPPAPAPEPAAPEPAAPEPSAAASQIDILKALRPDPAPAPAAPVEDETPEAKGPEVKAPDVRPGEAQRGDAKAGAAAPQHATIRVDLDRVDRLINLVGELVINQAMLSQAVFESDLSKNASVAGGLDELDQLTREIQESVMAIRAQPLKPLFQRMSRIVREVAEATGKQVRLVTEGEWTEVDKTVVERLADPLTHMIRNAIDHGVEKPEVRREKGKDPEGVVKLSAAHRSGRVVIEVSDDGAGVNREKVRKLAVDKGLIAADAQLTDGEIDNLLFLPGFSTVDKVSNISGRGVGMDVVKKSIHALSGRIFIRSKAGQGSTITLSLPLTLAVLDGMVVSVAGQTLVAPLSAIIETMSLGGDRVKPLGDTGSVIRDRDGFVPIIDTASELGFAAPRRIADEAERGVALLVESEGGGRSALVVDAIQDQRQVVIKSLETNYGRVPGVAAATILGDGRVALILDVDTLVARARGDAAAEPLLAAAG